MKNLFAGLDVADRTTAVCIVDSRGGIVFEGSSETTPEQIAALLKPYRKSLQTVGLETGTNADWLFKALSKSKLPMRCLDARQAHAALNARLNKTDANDAQGLARLLAGGSYALVHVKSDEAARIRTLLTLRDALVNRSVDLRRIARVGAKKLADCDALSGRGQKVYHTAARNSSEVALASITRMADILKAECRELDSLVETLASDNPITSRLMTIPGVGPITALSFYATVDDPSRFSSSRLVAAYFGLTPRVFQSGVSSRSGGISHRGDEFVRKALYAAGRTMLIRCKTDCALKRWGLRLAKQKGARSAYTAVARKLAVLMHHMWVTGEDFDPAR